MIRSFETYYHPVDTHLCKMIWSLKILKILFRRGRFCRISGKRRFKITLWKIISQETCIRQPCRLDKHESGRSLSQMRYNLGKGKFGKNWGNVLFVDKSRGGQSWLSRKDEREKISRTNCDQMKHSSSTLYPYSSLLNNVKSMKLKSSKILVKVCETLLQGSFDQKLK